MPIDTDDFQVRRNLHAMAQGTVDLIDAGRVPGSNQLVRRVALDFLHETETNLARWHVEHRSIQPVGQLQPHRAPNRRDLANTAAILRYRQYAPGLTEDERTRAREAARAADVLDAAAGTKITTTPPRRSA